MPGAGNLIGLLGSNNAPDLQGMFLRGAGTNNLTPETTVLNGTQDDIFQSHLHNVSLFTNNIGNHSHSTAFSTRNITGGGGTTMNSELTSDGQFTRSTSTTGAHTHTVNGNTNSTGGIINEEETRPVNYGVNYIIKL